MMTSVAPRDVKRWGKPNVYYDNMDKFLSDWTGSSGIVTIKSDGSFVDLLYNRSVSDTLLVSFHPAIENRTEEKVPFFVDQNVCNHGTATLFVSDPAFSVDSSLGLGWFHGNSRLDFTAIFPVVLQRIKEVGKHKRIIFFGVSGGGYAAALFSSMFPGSIAVAVNPQTKIWKFNFLAVSQYLQGSFGIAAEPETLESAVKSAIGGDLSRYYRSKVRNRLIYVQNTHDHHQTVHAQPFLNALSKTARKQVTFIGSTSWGDGHIAPPAEYLSSLLGHIARNFDTVLKTGHLPGNLSHPDTAPSLQT
jgi:hypothetical protein